MNVKLIWHTPDSDKILAYMARCSNPENQNNHKTAPQLIRTMIKRKHWSPFEMANACFEIKTTRDISRQILRHKGLHHQEFSQRYQDVSVLPTPKLREARLQDNKNRQKSIPTDDKDLCYWWLNSQSAIRDVVDTIYKSAMKKGIAKEVARSILPEGLTPSLMYVNGTIRSWLHFLDVRLDEDAQKEIQDIALEIKEHLMVIVPNTMTAWSTYHATI